MESKPIKKCKKNDCFFDNMNKGFCIWHQPNSNLICLDCTNNAEYASHYCKDHLKEYEVRSYTINYCQKCFNSVAQFG
jgi:hypothetical protein